MYMDCVLESEEHLLHRLYSSWGMDHSLQAGTGYSGLDVSQKSTYLYFGGLFTLASIATVSCACCSISIFMINFSTTILLWRQFLITWGRFQICNNSSWIACTCTGYVSLAVTVDWDGIYRALKCTNHLHTCTLHNTIQCELLREKTFANIEGLWQSAKVFFHKISCYTAVEHALAHALLHP